MRLICWNKRKSTFESSLIVAFSEVVCFVFSRTHICNSSSCWRINECSLPQGYAYFFPYETSSCRTTVMVYWWSVGQLVFALNYIGTLVSKNQLPGWWIASRDVTSETYFWKLLILYDAKYEIDFWSPVPYIDLEDV